MHNRVNNNLCTKIISYFFSSEKQETVTPLVNKIYSQAVLIEQINLYLHKVNDELIKKNYMTMKNYGLHYRQPVLEGLCRGLAVLWLYKMANNDVEWFYKIVKKIVDWDGNNINDIAMDVEKLLAHLEWLNNSYRYTEDQGKKIEFRDLKELLEIENVFQKDKTYDVKDLKEVLRKCTPSVDMILISSIFKKIVTPENKEVRRGHGIALYKEKGIVYLYDANFDSGQAKVFKDVKSLMQEIKSCLYKVFNDKAPGKVPLKVDIFRFPQPRPTSDYKPNI